MTVATTAIATRRRRRQRSSALCRRHPGLHDRSGASSPNCSSSDASGRARTVVGRGAGGGARWAPGSRASGRRWVIASASARAVGRRAGVGLLGLVGQFGEDPPSVVTDALARPSSARPSAARTRAVSRRAPLEEMGEQGAPLDDVVAVFVARFARLGAAEHRRTVVVQHDSARLHVAVDEAPLVDLGESQCETIAPRRRSRCPRAQVPRRATAPGGIPAASPLIPSSPFECITCLLPSRRGGDQCRTWYRRSRCGGRLFSVLRLSSRPWRRASLRVVRRRRTAPTTKTSW